MPRTNSPTPFEQGIQPRHQRFPAGKGEAFLAHELGVQKVFEHHRLGQFPEEVALGGEIEIGPVTGGLHTLLQPADFFRGADVHELGPDGPAVGILEVLDNPAQRRRTDADLRARLEDGVEIGLGQAEVLQGQGGGVFAADAHRIGPGEEVAAAAVALDQVDDPELLGLDPGLRGGCGGWSGGGGTGRGGRRCGGLLHPAQFVALEEVAPTGLYAVGILPVPLQEVLDELGMGGVEV
jgi:hypothetical protein